MLNYILSKYLSHEPSIERLGLKNPLLAAELYDVKAINAQIDLDYYSEKGQEEMSDKLTANLGLYNSLMSRAHKNSEKAKYYRLKRDDCLREFAELLPEEENPEQWLEVLGIKLMRRGL